MPDEVIEIEAAGGLVYLPGENKVLLIKRSGMWDIPKGKLDNNESIENCAIREVCEETGVCDLKINSYLGVTYHTYERQNVIYGKKTYWFSMNSPSLPEKFKPQTDEGITKVKWVSLEEAETLVGYDNLNQVIRKFKKQVVSN